MTYGLNVYNGDRLALTSQLPLTLLLGAYSHAIGPVSRNITSSTPPLVFVRCTNQDIAWSIPRVVWNDNNSWTVAFSPLPYLLENAGLTSSVGAAGTFQVLVFGSKTTPERTGYGGILNTADLAAGPLAVDAHVRLDLNAADQSGLLVTSTTGRSVHVPDASSMALCAHVSRNSIRGSFERTALDTYHPVQGIPIGFGTIGNTVTSFQGYRSTAQQPGQYDDYWDIILVNPNKYV